MSSEKKLVLVGAHGTGKSKICEKIVNAIKETYNYSWENINNRFLFIPEQFREVVKDIPNFTQQTEEITLATYAKQLYLENLYTAQGKNILCDRSILDTFVYYDYFIEKKRDVFDIIFDSEIECTHYFDSFNYILASANQRLKWEKFYSKIYLIEPSDREIEDDGFRMTDKKQQLEIHKLFLKYFKDFDNVEIVNQEDAHKEEFVEKVANEFIL